MTQNALRHVRGRRDVGPEDQTRRMGSRNALRVVEARRAGSIENKLVGRGLLQNLKAIVGIEEMSLKASNYNFYFPIEAHGAALFNSRTGAAVAANEATSRAIALLLQDPEREIPTSSNFQRTKDMLVREGFLVADDIDELGEIRKSRTARQAEIRGLSLTVAVTRACNFRCVYCYQDHPIENMQLDTADALLHFATERLPAATALDVTWFGGEPLLNVEIIEYLSRGFKAICEEKGCSYSALMVTNGYRLTADMARRLAASDIRDYQISIDGEQDYHDRQRPLAGGQGTFDVLMKNLSAVAKEVSSISVRINLLRDNVDSAARLVRQLKTMQMDNPALSISLGHVDNSSDHCGTDQSNLLNGYEFSECRKMLLGQEGRCGVENSTLPMPFGTVCCADRLNSYVIAPNGEVFKCWNSLGRLGEFIGTLDGPVAEATSPWLNFQADEGVDCRKCKFLPVCQGGCSDIQIRSGRAQRECTELRYTLKQRLTEWALTSGEEPSPFIESVARDEFGARDS